MSGILLRLAREDDADAVRAIYAPHVADNSVSFETEVPTAQVMAQRIARLAPTHPWIVAERHGDVIGYAYASPHRERAAYRWSVEVTAYVDASAHRTGTGRRLYAALARVLRAQRFLNAFGIITLPNDASVGLHEALGYRHCATYRHAGYKFGAWHDVGWWQLALFDPAPVPPQEPIALSALPATAVAAALADA